MSLEGAKKKERKMSSELPAGAKRMLDAWERGDHGGVKAMRRKAAETRAANAQKRKAERALAVELQHAESDHAREKRTLDQIRDLEARGEIKFDPATDEIIRLYEPPED